MSQTVKDKVQLWADFGAWIKYVRESSVPKLTQEQAAKKAEMHTVQWSRIENGLSTKRDTVIAMAKAIKADVSEALRRAGFGEGSETTYDDDLLNDLSHSLHNYKQLSPNSRKFANRHFSETIRFLMDVEDHPEKNITSMLEDSTDKIDPEEAEEQEELDSTEFNRQYENHMEYIKDENFEQPPFLPSSPTQEEIAKQRRGKLPKNKKSLPKKQEGEN